MKTLFLISVLLPRLSAAEAPNRILAPVESTPTRIEGIEFSVVTQSEWRIPANLVHRKESVILQLRITNRTTNAILFPTFDSFSIQLKTASGAPVTLGGGRDETRITPNILLQPGSSFSLPLEAEIEYQAERQSVGFIVKDGTGSIESATLTAGNYDISFQVRPTHYDFAKGARLPAPLWAGKGSTASIGFKLNPP